MTDSKYLQMLAEKYPNHRSVKAEIINLRAILALPKGTEYFLSDLHGEYDAFQYFVRSASGTIKMKIDEHFSGMLSEAERESLAALIYDPVAEIKRRKKSEKDFDAWCKSAIYRLVIICDPYPVNTPGQKYVGFCRTTPDMLWTNFFLRTMTRIVPIITMKLSIPS